MEIQKGVTDVFRDEERHISILSRGHGMCRAMESSAVTYPVIAWLQDCVSHLCQLPTHNAREEGCPPSRPFSLFFVSPPSSSPPSPPSIPPLPPPFPLCSGIGLGVSHVLGKHSITELHPGFGLPHLRRTAWRLSWHLSVSFEGPGWLVLSHFAVAEVL